MTTPLQNLPRTTRPLHPSVLQALPRLRPGQRIRVTHTVRVGSMVWPVTVAGTFRAFGSLVTGLSTDRVPEDDVIVPTVHFVKDNHELTSVALDENSRLDILVQEEKRGHEKQGEAPF